MSNSELGKILNNKFVVFDTNILIESTLHMDAFKDLLSFLDNNNCNTVHFELTKFEFTRNAYKEKERQEKENFFDKLNSSPMPFSDQIMKDALEISRIYAHQKVQKGQISLVDCCIAAYLKQYEDKLFLLTANHKDFPISLFDRISIYPIDKGNDVLAPAFYKFNQEKWKDAKRNLEKVNE